jgi:hypothetical protein
MNRQKIKIMYFYSDLYESARKLSKLSKRIREEIGSVKIHLVNIEDSSNEDITELYGVSAVPVMIFLTSNGEVAARRSASLSDVKVIHEVADRISKGELPNPEAEKLRAKILEVFNGVTQRSNLTQLIVDQIRNDILEADSESEIYELLNSHISLINHTVCDLEQFKRALQRFSKKPEFLV